MRVSFVSWDANCSFVGGRFGLVSRIAMKAEPSFFITRLEPRYEVINRAAQVEKASS